MLSVTSFISAANYEQVINKVDTLADKIEAILVKYRIPAVGITILSPEKPVQIYTLGIVNKTQQTQVTQDHLFRFGSITKMIPGIAILQLQEQGKLELTDNLRDIAQDITFENKWQQTYPIKVMHLYEHTTGWDSYPAEQKILKDDALSLKEAFEIYPQSREPLGTRFAFSI